MLLLALVPACSDRSTMDDAAAGGTDDDGATDGSADDTTEAPACEWEPAPIPVPFDEAPAPECQYLVSEGEIAPVTIRIVNEGDEVLYLTGPGSCIRTHFALRDADDRPFPAPECVSACEDALEGNCGCLANCPLVGTIALHPGGAFEAPWDGYTVSTQEASPECAGDCAGECGLRGPPTAGPMSVLLAVASTLDCGDDCDCEPNAEGYCIVPGYPEAFPSIVERTVAWPTPCPVVELTLP
ncbi:MAG: hypothetical protein H6712_02570 [Myxococcales bacterium]|nr:hypothetical protein [Myxococcales bacterium]